VIPNGVRAGSGQVDEAAVRCLRQRLGISAKGLVVGTVARFNWKKGYEFFIRAVAIVVKEMPTVRFVAFGDGPLKDEMTALVARLGLRDHILFAGWEPDVRSKLALFDIYVCASIIEGMSNAILEAMAERRPVIATAVGGNPETIRDGETGCLVPPADPKSLATAILDLAQDPDRRRAMGEAARTSVERDFTVTRMVERMQDFYTTLHGANAAPADALR
jgi:glycosyltransferase involved in cell wall biosynthesis